MKSMVIKIFLVFFLLSNVNILFSQNRKYNGIEKIYTNRDLTRTDTLYLPIDRPCMLRITVMCCVREYQKIDNEPYKHALHPLTNDSYVLGNDSVDAKNCCWLPSYFRIAPLTTIVYVDSIRYPAYDVILLRMDKKSRIQFWEAQCKTEVGKSIVDYMPFIEMYLWEKITDETTLTSNKTQKTLYEFIDVQILPSEDNSCLSICKSRQKNKDMPHRQSNN